MVEKKLKTLLLLRMTRPAVGLGELVEPKLY